MKAAVIALAVGAFMASPAMAWDYRQAGHNNQQIGDGATGTQNNNSAKARSSSRSSSRSTSHSNSVATGGSAGGGSSDVTVQGNPREAATALAPSFSGVNPCAGSAASGAVQTGVFGLSIGTGGGFDKVCQIATYLHDPLAKAWACRHIDGIREAALDIGKPCPQDKPTPVNETEIIRHDRPDWCLTASARERLQHLECQSGSVYTIIGE